MDVLSELQSLLLGLMGWAATLIALEGASRLTANERRAMAVCCWVLWMAPAFGALTLNGVLTTDMAALYVGLTTLAIGAIELLGAIGGRPPRTRP